MNFTGFKSLKRAVSGGKQSSEDRYIRINGNPLSLGEPIDSLSSLLRKLNLLSKLSKVPMTFVVGAAAYSAQVVFHRATGLHPFPFFGPFPIMAGIADFTASCAMRVKYTIRHEINIGQNFPHMARMVIDKFGAVEYDPTLTSELAAYYRSAARENMPFRKETIIKSIVMGSWAKAATFTAISLAGGVPWALITAKAVDVLWPSYTNELMN